MPPNKQKVLELDDEPTVKQEPGVEQQQQQQQQAAREALGVEGGDGAVEALVSATAACARRWLRATRARSRSWSVREFWRSS